MVDFAIVGFAMVGFTMVDFAMVGFAIIGFTVVDLSMAAKSPLPLPVRKPRGERCHRRKKNSGEP